MTISCINCAASTTKTTKTTNGSAFAAKRAGEVLREGRRRFSLTAEEALTKFHLCCRTRASSSVYVDDRRNPPDSDTAEYGENERFICKPCFQLLVKFVKCAEDAVLAGQELQKRRGDKHSTVDGTVEDSVASDDHHQRLQIKGEHTDDDVEEEEDKKWLQLFKFHADLQRQEPDNIQEPINSGLVDSKEKTLPDSSASATTHLQKISSESEQEDGENLDIPKDIDMETTQTSDVETTETLPVEPTGLKTQSSRKKPSKKVKNSSEKLPDLKRDDETIERINDGSGVLYRCKVCCHQTVRKYSMQQHVLTKHKQSQCLCWHCGLSFVNKKTLATHLKFVERKEKLLCSVCGTSFGSAEGMRLHKSLHSQPADTVCNICQKQFSSSLVCEKHVKAVHLGITHPCSDCGKVFRFESSLCTHRVTCGKQEPRCFQCSICSKTFSRRDYVLTHIRGVHSLEKSFVCQKCGKQFRYKSGLNKHRVKCIIKQ